MSVLPDALSQRFKNFLQPQRVAIGEACLIGLVSGLAAVLLQQGISSLGTLRLMASTHGPPWLILPAFGLVGGLAAGWLIDQLEPTANGSGIPQVKVALARLPMPLNFKVAIAKLFSTVLSLGSGLMLGRQGPTVQVGASLAAQLSYLLPTVPGQRRQMIAAGAGAGLAAGFNAPLAGVLFVIESLLQDMSGLTLGTAIIASFIGSVIARVFGGQSFSIVASQVDVNTSFSVPEIPFYILLGILAGILGGVFNQGLIQGLERGHRYLKLPLMVRIAIAGSLTGLVLGCLPEVFRNNAGLREMISYSSDLSWQFVAIAFGLQFILTIVAYSSDAPGGVFAPSLVLGAALGHLVGIAQIQILGAGEIVTYSLVGMGAFFGAVSRVPMTGIVIIFEMTTDFNLVLPLMICAVVSFLVAERIQPGSIYDCLLAEQQPDGPEQTSEPGILNRLSAADIMQRRVETLSSRLPLRDVKEAFAKSHHRGFPVVESGRLVGIISQSDLTSSARSKFSDESPLSDMMTPAPITVVPEATLSEVLYLLDHYSLSRLPVVEGRKLVGIITRADIIRAESEELSEEGYRLQPRLEPSYVVYQTRSPATGTGRMLVPLSNPDTAPVLLRMAMA
ncbi:MAG: chloride channel protein, partial [Cyanobacteria bacterium P01_F01_bin.42]